MTILSKAIFTPATHLTFPRPERYDNLVKPFFLGDAPEILAGNAPFLPGGLPPPPGGCAATRGLQRPYRGLLLGGEKKALLAELVRQKLQLRDLLRGERSGPWTAGDLPDVGVDMVYGGVRIYLLPGHSGADRGLLDQLAEISCDRQSGDGQIAAQPLVLFLRHADGQGTAIVPHRWAWLVFIPHRGTPAFALARTVPPPGPGGGGPSPDAGRCRNRY